MSSEAYRAWPFIPPVRGKSQLVQDHLTHQPTARPTSRPIAATLLAGTLLLALLFAMLVPTPASAATSVEEVAAALDEDSVYVDEDAENPLTSAEERSLEEEIESSGEPIYVAVLPEESAAGRSASDVLRSIADEHGERGTYAVVVGDSFRAGSNALPAGVAARAATEAIGENRSAGTAPTLEDFVRRVDAAAAGSPPARDRQPDGGGSAAGGFLAGLLPIIILFGIPFLLIRRMMRVGRGRASRRSGGMFGGGMMGGGMIGGWGTSEWSGGPRGRAPGHDYDDMSESERMADVRATVESDVRLLANDVIALDSRVREPGTPEAARDAYAAAASAYNEAQEALSTASRLRDLEALATRVADARFHMAVARAHLDGKPLPERRVACFFDPNHGPSYRDVAFDVPAGGTRLVPACDRCARLVDRGSSPEPRHVEVRGVDMPYWNAPAYYTPYYGGFFGGGSLLGGAAGGLLGGMVLGSLLGGGMFTGTAFGAGSGAGVFDEVGGGDLGDFGGGDFGDFGGGDF